MRQKKNLLFKRCLLAVCCLVLLCGSMVPGTKQQTVVSAYAAEEGVEGFINRLYELILGRTADEEGLETWTRLLRTGERTGVGVAEGFILSDEFLNNSMSNKEFVEIMYRTFLDREADEGGLATWLGMMRQGYQKKFIFSGFANSDEFQTICDGYGIERGFIELTDEEKRPMASEGDLDVTQFVERLYSEILGRPADADGLNTWVTLLENGAYSGAEVAEGFIMSDEFIDTDMTNEEFVHIMYRTFFDREADEGGLTTWMNALEEGCSKRFVFAGFANSAEFENLCEDYAIIRGNVSALEGAPEAPRVSNSEDMSEVWWTSITGVAQYGVWRSKTGEEDSYSCVAVAEWRNNYNDWDVENGELYYYKISAIDPGTGEQSELSEACANVYLNAMWFDQDRETRIDSTSITIYWQTNEQATGYELSICKTDDSDNKQKYTIADNTIDSFVFTDLQPDTEYSITCRSYQTIEGIGTFSSLFADSRNVFRTEPDSETVIEGPSKYFEWKEKEDGTVEITGLKDESLIEIEIPSEIEGKKVTSVGSHAFFGMSNVKSVILSDNIISIGSAAFADCSSLEYVQISDNVTNVGNHLFQNCNSLKNIELSDNLTDISRYMFYNCSSLTNIELPLNVTNISDNAFRNCSSLESIILPNKVVGIGSSAFEGCSNLESIEMSNGVTCIGRFAFYGCTGLKKIKLSDSIISIGAWAFYQCISLSSIVLPTNLTNIDSYAFCCCDNLVNIYIPNSVIAIGSSAFGFCSNLSNIELPSSITYIEDDMFYSCSSLTSVKFSDNITGIGNDVFNGCESIESIQLPEGVITIGDFAFANCNNLKNIILPDSVTTIGNDVFINCESLECIMVSHDTYAEEWAEDYYPTKIQYK